MGGYRRACGLESFELPIKLNEAVLPSLDLLVQARGREVPLGHEGDQVGQLVLGLPATAAMRSAKLSTSLRPPCRRHSAA